MPIFSPFFVNCFQVFFFPPLSDKKVELVCSRLYHLRFWDLQCCALSCTTVASPIYPVPFCQHALYSEEGHYSKTNSDIILVFKLCFSRKICRLFSIWPRHCPIETMYLCLGFMTYPMASLNFSARPSTINLQNILCPRYTLIFVLTMSSQRFTTNWFGQSSAGTTSMLAQWLLKGPDFRTLSRSGPMSKKSPEKGPICLLSPEVY